MSLGKPHWYISDLNYDDHRPIESTKEWEITHNILSVRRSRRTDVPYFDHVAEGVKILAMYSAPLIVQQAFVIHPLLQHDDALIENLPHVKYFDPLALVLCMEYRRVANLGTRKNIRDTWEITLSPIAEVNLMLVADKIQNRKLYETKLPKDDPDYEEIGRYFLEWMKALGIPEVTYKHIVSTL